VGEIGLSFTEFLNAHFFQPDYYQFYILLFLGWIWLEWKFNQLMQMRLTVMVKVKEDIENSM